MLKILGIGQGKFIPSYRYRLKEVVNDFYKQNVHLSLFETDISSYPPKNKVYRLYWIIRVLINRLPLIISQYNYDIIILQREMISTLYTIERFLKIPYIMDVDDAIHLNQKKYSIDKIAKKASAVVVCNEFLSNYYSKLHENVYIIPTPVNTEKYRPKSKKNIKQITIGWIGTSSNFKSLKSIEKELSILLEKHPNIILKVVSNNNPNFTLIEKSRYIFKKWSDIDDVEDIQSFDIGIMPLLDTEHSRGKCAFKMLQYMSCGLPVVSSDLPMNRKIVEMRECGFCVSKKDDWINALTVLSQSQSKREVMGNEGRKTIEQFYSTKVYVKLYKNVILNVLSKGN